MKTFSLPPLHGVGVAVVAFVVKGVDDMAQKKTIEEEEILLPQHMPVLVLRGLVLFPDMVLHFDVAREKSVLALNHAMSEGRKIFLVAQKDISVDEPEMKDLYTVGVVAEIKQVIRAKDESLRVVVDGKERAKLVSMTEEEAFFMGYIEPMPLQQKNKKKELSVALLRTVKDLFEEYSQMVPQMPRELVKAIMVTRNYKEICEPIIRNIPLKYEDKQEILEESDILKRLEMLVVILNRENEILSIENDIHERVKDQIDKHQREYYLREQIKAINSELPDGEGSASEIENYRERLIKLEMGIQSTTKLLKEIDRLEKMPYNSQEASVIRSYLDTIMELPWNVYTKDKIDIQKARTFLDKEHFGLVKVKERIIESLAVRKLAPDIKGQIICLVGPPGVGKTSIVRSIAQSMGRNYVRLSLGGVRDESDIRGHRRTYIASMPGRIINAVKQAGSSNPLMLLDEIDKLGNDFRGDPSSALLEVLDGEQNNTFRDHYLEIPYDLSNVFFIATANNLQGIPRPLLDRMEIIQLGSYTREEKFNIAKKHLVPKQLKRHGITGRQLQIDSNALYDIVDFYTKEAGVRTLERLIATIARKRAVQLVGNETGCKALVNTKGLEKYLGPHKFKNDDICVEDQIGVVNGLAWTSVGGEMLQVEVAIMEGSGKNRSTGSLGDVMKESIQAATTYIRGVAGNYGIDITFYKTKDIHIHFPEGAVPKDGPSAGIATCTALVSALSGIPVRHDIAMTGEITLRGRVLPIGGLREKTMAAYKYGMKTVIIPKANIADLEEVEQIVKDNITFIPAEDIETVLKHALVTDK